MPRDPRHDYRSVCIYHITINKAKATPDFCTISGSLNRPKTDYSSIGYVVKNTICHIQNLDDGLRLLQYAVMPDHVHILLHVQRYLPHHLGAYISMIKIEILHKLRNRKLYDDAVFESDYYDRILRPWHSLQVIFDYIRQNPRRLLVRRLYPDYFRRANHLFEYHGFRWQGYGNMNLIANPFKEAVVCHRSDQDTDREKALQVIWEHTATNGGVLVSPFISKAEKAIRKMAEELNGRIILISNEAFSEKYKPGGHDFELCERGCLLIIAPDKTIPAGRESFLCMNALAEILAYGNQRQ